MDPIDRLLGFLKEQIPEIDRAVEEPIRKLLSKFELVPKHEYEAHTEILKSLEAQIKELESRVNTLEDLKKD